MKRFVLSLFILFSSTTYASLDAGTGAFGICDIGTAGTITSIDTNVKSEYNCTELLTTSSITITGSNPLVFKVQGDATIDHTITISPGEAGGYAEAQGPSGATSVSADASVCGGISFADIGGAGGAGGSHPTAGVAGGVATSSAAIDPGTDTQSSPGSVDATYDSALSLETNMRGGAGGGAGGEGCDSLANTQPGGAGGAGGGAIHIAAGGNIYINASISVDGAAGGNGLVNINAEAGAGGGGAGGVIFLQAAFDMEITAALSALGASGGTATGSLAGDGGAGADGIIRLDDFDGSIVGSNLASPTPTTVSLGTSGIETLSSGIEPGCAVREDMTPKNQSILGAIILLSLLIGLNIKEFKKAHA